MNSLWADPRGAYAILGLLALGILGASMAPGGLRDGPRRSRRLIAAAVLVGAALSLLWPHFTRGRALDANPVSAPSTQLAGAWLDGIDTLRLGSDGRYTCNGPRCTGFGARGTWSTGDGASLTARWSDGHVVTWRVVTYNGRYRLALLPEGDVAAAWEGRLYFERVDP